MRDLFKVKILTNMI